jgi:kynurenine 3-monooxygenase
VVILGDAAHTICPFLWQAVNVGFDDCLYLDKVIDQYGFTEEAFNEYFKLQKPKADALA